ncbi:hypothetical protein B296_00035650 [Ensete ventricosum]|uniref:Uncharacterized protein n=1 Tax=Ensete ventricosum TaxID=4639 RepID=A0A426XRR1_ENSVE|nr:hypothetical protein B296_00035650 [Ensete ventricosum]
MAWSHRLRRWKFGGGGGRRRRRGQLFFEEGSSAEAKEVALRQRDLAVEEAVRSRNVVRQQRKELKARMVEVAWEEWCGRV